MRKTSRLRRMIESSSLEFLMEAHNGLSAKIVQDAGFKGIWASGLSISAALGVRDANEASWTQMLEVVEFMADATDIPILHDADTGYGNFNSVRRLVRKLEDRDIAGMCIEDKIFPKTNSFLYSEKQALADIDEFCGKIRAAKDTQRDPDFVVIARTESFVVGKDLEEALERAEAYRRAGADAILVHSKRPDAQEIEAFTRAWEHRHPLVIVPTKYWKTPTSTFSELGISVVIWANHIMRAALAAMEAAAAEIFRTQSVAGVEERIAPLSRVFALQDVGELHAAEEKYLSPSPVEPLDQQQSFVKAPRGATRLTCLARAG